MKFTKEEKKEIKREANKVGLGLILYHVLLMCIVFIPFILGMLYLGMYYPDATEDSEIFLQVEEKCMSTGLFYMIGVTVGILFLRCFFRKKIDFSQITHKNRSMDGSTFIKLLCVFASMQIVASILVTILEGSLNLFGFSAMAELEIATQMSTTFTMLLYASFFGPVVEELIYRGFVLRIFEHHGKMTAILISSLLFSIMHANIPQGIIAFLFGLVLGYVALEYSISWAIALHVINNFLFSDVLSFLLTLTNLSEEMQGLLSYAIMLPFFCVAIFTIWVERKQIINYWHENRTNKGILLQVFLSVGLFIFTAMELYVAITSLQRI